MPSKLTDAPEGMLVRMNEARFRHPLRWKEQKERDVRERESEKKKLPAIKATTIPTKYRQENTENKTI